MHTTAMHPTASSRILFGFLAIVLLIGLAVKPRSLLDEVSRLAPPRMMAPQLSVALEYRRCPQATVSGGSIPQTHCPSQAEPLPLNAISRLWRRARHSRDSPEALQTMALLELLWPRREGNSLDHTIWTLQSAARRGGSSGALADLSAAYLVRAQRTRNARDLLEAMVVAQQALESEPNNRAAQFNLALALDWYGLDEQASNAWKQYLMIDETSGWATEARERVRTLAGEAVPPPPPGSATSVAEIDAYVMRAPQEARLYGWDHLLGEWGEAELRGDTARAAERLRLAQALGNALVRRGGDATLAAAAHAILARTGDPAATGKLAQAHVEYAAGQAAYYGVDYAAAGEHFARTLEIHAPSPSLESWARLFHASMLIATGKAAAAEPMLRALASQTDTLRGPALAGRSRWALATALLRSGRYEAALGSARDGARLLGRAGEHELQYAAQYVAADAEFYLGAMPAAHETAQRGLVALRRNHGSIWLLNTLSVAAKTAEADGLPLAAIRIQGERVMRAERLKIPVRVAEARLGRARLLADAGMLEQARTDVDASEPLVNGLPAGPSRTWLGADLRLARAAILRSNSPARASAALDSVLAISAGSLTAPRLLRAWVGRADARLAMGNVQGAEEDLNAASVLLARERDAIAVTEFRASLLNAARGVFDRLTMIRLAARDTAGALRYLERGRTSFGPTGRDSVGQEEGRWRMRPGEVAAAYAMVGDTLLVWTVAGTDLRLFRRTVNREELVGAIDELRSSLERGMDGESVRHALEALYERLVRPIESRLGDVNTTLVLIADGELAPVPFSALYDARHRRHLMETHPVRYAGSLRDAVRTRAHAPPDDLTALLVADPAFDARMQPDLLRLAGARAEVDSIAAAYPRHYVLSDSGAARGALTAALPGARVVHFAGHAVFDDQRPERSFLVLASERGGTGPARLTAAEMEEMPLQHVDLVVLSACETLRARNGRSDGFAGFAGALLDAGTGGVVGSLWRVDDRLTTPLMIEFHRAYRRSGDGPQALRDAQLQMLRSPDPALRSPAAWAGFRYAGN